jgi:hypothetical protein
MPLEVEWPAVLEADQIGTLRDNGIACDIGAAQTVPTPEGP